MTMIFIGGSQSIFELPSGVIASIGNIIAAEHGIVIGDAPGADAEAQSLLAGYGYDHVGVFHAERTPRNNLGDWAAYYIETPEAGQPFSVHDEMVRRADYGLMVWDGASAGTALNVMRLALIGSPCVVHDISRGTVGTVRDIIGWRDMIARAGSEVARQVDARMTPDERFESRR